MYTSNSTLCCHWCGTHLGIATKIKTTILG